MISSKNLTYEQIFTFLEIFLMNYEEKIWTQSVGYFSYPHIPSEFVLENKKSSILYDKFIFSIISRVLSGNPMEHIVYMI